MTFEGVGHDYGRTVALEGFDLSVAPGELVALLGPNGAGKTTAMHALMGLLEPKRGRVRLMGRDPRERAARMLRIKIGAELLKHLRLLIYAVSTIAFPVMFYVLFATMQNGGGPVHVPTYMLATYGAFGVIGASMFSFGVSVAVERAQGWMRLKHASSLPGAVTVVARLATALVFSAAIVAVLLGVGTLVAGVHLMASEVLALFGVHLLTAPPFCVIGQALGYALGPNFVPVVINLAYLPMVLASGLWMPIDVLPPFVQAVAPWLPAYHHGQRALASLASLAPPPRLSLGVRGGACRAKPTSTWLGWSSSASNRCSTRGRAYGTS